MICLIEFSFAIKLNNSYGTQTNMKLMNVCTWKPGQNENFAVEPITIILTGQITWINKILVHFIYSIDKTEEECISNSFILEIIPYLQRKERRSNFIQLLLWISMNSENKLAY